MNLKCKLISPIYSMGFVPSYCLNSSNESAEQDMYFIEKDDSLGFEFILWNDKEIGKWIREKMLGLGRTH